MKKLLPLFAFVIHIYVYAQQNITTEFAKLPQSTATIEKISFPQAPTIPLRMHLMYANDTQKICYPLKIEALLNIMSDQARINGNAPFKPGYSFSNMTPVKVGADTFFVGPAHVFGAASVPAAGNFWIVRQDDRRDIAVYKHKFRPFDFFKQGPKVLSCTAETPAHAVCTLEGIIVNLDSASVRKITVRGSCEKISKKATEVIHDILPAYYREYPIDGCLIMSLPLSINIPGIETLAGASIHDGKNIIGIVRHIYVSAHDEHATGLYALIEPITLESLLQFNKSEMVIIK